MSPSHLARFVVYTCKLENSDGRLSYPMVFIFSSPKYLPTTLNIPTTHYQCVTLMNTTNRQILSDSVFAKTES